jgi:hypothetical protein
MDFAPLLILIVGTLCVLGRDLSTELQSRNDP